MADRGSSQVWAKAFEADAPHGEALQTALKAARSEFTIERWMKYGQPRIDLIKATVSVDPANVGSFVQGLYGQHGNGVSISILGVFPYGIPVIKHLVVDVALEREVGQ